MSFEVDGFTSSHLLAGLVMAYLLLSVSMVELKHPFLSI